MTRFTCWSACSPGSLIALLLRRPVTSWPPLLWCVALILWNETVDLWVEQWPDPGMQYGECAKDVLLTMLRSGAPDGIGTASTAIVRKAAAPRPASTLGQRRARLTHEFRDFEAWAREQQKLRIMDRRGAQKV